MQIENRKGVLVFERDGSEERVLFLASKFYVFEKRLGTKQSLDQVSFFIFFIHTLIFIQDIIQKKLF